MTKNKKNELKGCLGSSYNKLEMNVTSYLTIVISFLTSFGILRARLVAFLALKLLHSQIHFLMRCCEFAEMLNY